MSTVREDNVSIPFLLGSAVRLPMYVNSTKLFLLLYPYLLLIFYVQELSLFDCPLGLQKHVKKQWGSVRRNA
jgi:hypothetical protein